MNSRIARTTIPMLTRRCAQNRARRNTRVLVTTGIRKFQTCQRVTSVYNIYKVTCTLSMAPPTEISDIFLIVRFPQHVILTLCLLSALSIPTMSTSSVDDEGPPEGTLDSNFLQEQLERILSALMTPAIDGVYAVVEATNVRRNRYLEQQSGDVESAVSAAIQYNSNMGKLKTLLISLVPGVGIPGSVLVPVWNQIRTAALVASLYGFDVSEPEVQCDILLCLVESDVRKTGKKVMSEVGRRVAHELVKKVTSKVTARLVSRLIPFGVIYDALTDSTSSAGKHAQKYFR